MTILSCLYSAVRRLICRCVGLWCVTGTVAVLYMSGENEQRFYLALVPVLVAYVIVAVLWWRKGFLSVRSLFWDALLLAGFAVISGVIIQTWSFFTGMPFFSAGVAVIALLGFWYLEFRKRNEPSVSWAE